MAARDVLGSRDRGMDAVSGDQEVPRVPKAEDDYFHDGTIEEARGGDVLWDITLADGMKFFLGTKHGIRPLAGQGARVYLDVGRPWGLPRARVRGVDLDGEEVFYSAPSEKTLSCPIV